MFSSFDVCLLPTHISEKKGLIFPYESIVRGAFDVGTPEIKVQMSIAKKTDVYCQILMDCCISEIKSEEGFQTDASNLLGNRNCISLKTFTSYHLSWSWMSKIVIIIFWNHDFRMTISPIAGQPTCTMDTYSIWNLANIQSFLPRIMSKLENIMAENGLLELFLLTQNLIRERILFIHEKMTEEVLHVIWTILNSGFST